MRRLQKSSSGALRCGSHARTAAVLLMTFAIASSALAAQGRKRGGGDPSAPSRPTVAPTLWEPDQIFPLAVAHAADLKLTDVQRTQIETIASKLRASNAPILLSIDTLKPEPPHLPDPNNPSAPTPTPPPPTPEQIAAIVARRHALGDARAQLHENIRLARDQMTQLMTPEQQARLEALETNARTAAERGDPGSSGDARGSGGGGRGGHHGGGQTPPGY